MKARRQLRANLRRGLALALLAAGLAVPAAAQARSIALLLGIGQFDGVGLATAAERARLSLEGPPLDIAAMRRVVESQIGVLPEDLHVLLDHEASRANIRACRSALHCTNSKSLKSMLTIRRSRTGSRFGPRT